MKRTRTYARHLHYFSDDALQRIAASNEWNLGKAAQRHLDQRAAERAARHAAPRQGLPQSLIEGNPL